MTPEMWTVLIVDDNADDCHEVRRLLLGGSGRRYRFAEAETAASARRVWEDLRTTGSGPDVIILDFSLPDATALDLLHDLSAGTGIPPSPVVVLTGSVGPTIGVSVLQAGAQDFLAKSDLSAGYLTRAIENAVERYRLQQALRESEARFRLMANQTPVIMWVHDASGRLEFVNDEYCRFFGVTLEDVRGPNWQPLVHQDNGAYIEAFERAMVAHTAFRADARVRRTDGEWRWVASYGVPRLAPSGEFVGMIGVSPDITEQRAAGEAQREAARQKDEFIAVLAHELRNPLAPIRASVGVLRAHGPIDPVLERCRDIIDRQVAHMARLLDDLLDVSRLARGRLTLRTQLLRLRDVIDAAVETVQPIIDSRRHVLTVDQIDATIVLDGDSARLSQVFSNLLNNAAKYTAPGGQIRIGVHRDADRVAVVVRDTGIGIEPSQKAHIFDLFTQVEDARHQADGGLGIGLSLTKRLVEMHGGTIDVASAGRHLGSAFTVTLPIEHRGDAGLSLAPRPPRGSSAPVDTMRRRVLIVDDNHDAADILALFLETVTCEVRAVYDGESALDEARAFRPDLVLLDLGMPGLNGQAVCRRLRQESWGTSVVIAAVTGWGQETDRRETRAAGFDHHLVKPVDPERLIQIVRELPQQRLS